MKRASKEMDVDEEEQEEVKREGIENLTDTSIKLSAKKKTKARIVEEIHESDHEMVEEAAA